jgi:hypothetical protein
VGKVEWWEDDRGVVGQEHQNLGVMRLTWVRRGRDRVPVGTSGCGGVQRSFVKSRRAREGKGGSQEHRKIGVCGLLRVAGSKRV